MSEWKHFEDNPPSSFSGIYQVKLDDDSIKKAYFYQDRIQWIAFYGQKPSYWWDYRTKEPLFNVTHWRIFSKND